MYTVQILFNDAWRDLTYPNAMSWDDAVELFSIYMQTWTENDYRIYPA